MHAGREMGKNGSYKKARHSCARVAPPVMLFEKK